MQRLLIVTTVPRTLAAFLLPLARWCRDRGVHVGFAASDGPEWGSLGHECDFRVILPSVRRTWLISRYFSFVRQLRDAVVTHGVTCVHVHTPVAAILGRMAVAGLDVGVVYTAHGFLFHRGAPLMRWVIHFPLERILARATDALLVINDEDHNRARRWLLRGRGRVVQCPGVGIERSTAPMESRDRLPVRVVMLAEFNPEKGHSELLRALSLLPQGLITVDFMGDGPLLEKSKIMATRLGLDGTVTFLGWVQGAEQRLPDYDLMVLPSRREGLPRSVLEAMAVGLPVIGADTRGIRDLLKNGAGVLYPSGSSPRLAHELARLARSPGLRAQYGRAAWERSSDYAIEEVLRVHRTIYSRWFAEFAQ